MTLSKPLFSMNGPKGVRIDILPGAVVFYVLFAAVIGLFQGLVIGVLAYPLMFVLAVLTHEWGHARSALRRGFAVKRIALNFGGGQCDTAGSDVRDVFWMVLMGPMASLGMAALSIIAACVVAVCMNLQGVELSLTADRTQAWVWLSIFSLINLAFCVLNLFPFQPLDGGKLVHLGLSCVMHPDRARLIAGGVGLVLGLVWIPVMVWLLTWGLLIPVFPHLQTHWKMVFGGETGPEVLVIHPTPEPA